MAYILADNYESLRSQTEKALNDAITRVREMLGKFGSGTMYPGPHRGGQYTPIPNADPRGFHWTEGFWPGCLWLSYEVTGDEEYRKVADKHVDDLYKRVYENYVIDMFHDTGFLYTPSCVSAYKLTGNETARKAALTAAYSLSRRFRYIGEFIQSMSMELDEENYKFIVDTMLNVPLLFWAAEETGDESYRDKAVKHIRTTLKYAMREDGTTFHHVLMDTQTGLMKKGLTWQGVRDDSCWSRGQAWVIYGLALAYSYTKDDAILEPFMRATDYFLEHLPEDSIPFWDFAFTDGDDEPRDSSAAAITVCGILEMAQHLPADKYNMQKYLDKAVVMLRSMMNKYALKLGDGKDGLLYHCTCAKPQGFWEEGECLPYGDYFYLEALVRATRDWKKYW